MTVRRLAPADAQMYWMSRAIPNDQFLVYAFGGAPCDIEPAVQAIVRRAQTSTELALRVADTECWRYPQWQRCEVGADRVVVHELAEPTWHSCLQAVAGLADDQLDAAVTPWRLHVFGGVEDLPGAGRGVVAVLQISHALGDGQRSSALAGYLFGRPSPIPPPVSVRHALAMMGPRAFAAARAHRGLVRDESAGLVPAPAFPRPVLRSNARPGGARRIRMMLRERGTLPGPTVTVAVLTAVAAALSGHLGELGEDTAQLGAEVPMAKSGIRRANNHFGNVGVGLHPRLATAERRRAIALDLYERRRRAGHPAMRAESAAFAVVPAPLLRWGVAQFDPNVRSDMVTGNTVVSSVNRGAKDLRFGAAPVVFTTGFPGLSPMMGLTHGVHGIGDTIAISVYAADSAVGDIDAYVERLARELRL